MRIFPLIAGSIACFVGLFTYRYHSRDIRILVYYLSISLLGELISTSLGYFGKNNLWMIHIFTVVKYVFFMMIFSFWQSNMTIRRIIYVSIPTFIIIYIICFFFFESLRQFNNYTKPIESIIIIITASYSLFEISKTSTDSLFVNPRFWIASGVLIYTTSTIIIFALSNVLLVSTIKDWKILWLIIPIMDIIEKLVFTEGLLCSYRARKFGGH